ncbi:MAG: hypothetical protein JO202_14780 [Ktedonobacteraceae bacterium]|nr:hypothetical protein [Ktedonobacteraceae bacterium]
MTQQELSLDIQAAHPTSDDLIYIERRGDNYSWRHTTTSTDMLKVRADIADGSLPDVWIYYSGTWPTQDPDRWQAFFDDLLAEMESMGGGADRCRWSLDEPWPHMH